MRSLQTVDRAFENSLQVKFNQYRFTCLPIRTLEQNVRAIRSATDSPEVENQELRFQLWKIMQTVVGWLDTFESMRSVLSEPLSVCSTLMKRFPSVSSLLPAFETSVNDVLTASSNPKRDFLSQSSDGFHVDSVMTKLSSVRIPMWADLSHDEEVVLGGTNLRVINSVRTIPLNSDGVLIPCGFSSKDTPGLLRRALCSGVTGSFNVLLYDFESARLPSRPSLPVSVLPAVNKVSIVKEDVETVVDIPSESDWADQYFWEQLHGAGRGKSFGESVPARYFLFRNGTGTFLKDNQQVFSLNSHVLPEGDHDIRQTQARFLKSGDWVILREGQSEELLDDVYGDLYDAESVAVSDDVPVWVNWLESVSLQKTPRDISDELSLRGVTIKPAQIRSWVEQITRGPANEEMFVGLLTYLIGERQPELTDLKQREYIQQQWLELESYRAHRRRAGVQIRSDLFATLKDSLEHKKLDPESDNPVHLGIDNQTRLLVVRIDSVDSQLSFVPPSRIAEIDDHRRGARWLG